MKVTIHHKNSEIKKNEFDLYNQFIKFLQKNYTLNSDVYLIFIGNKIGKMTTGLRSKDKILILTKGRMNRDILRTLAHEWVHEYQKTILKRKKGKDIGGKNENEANAFAGILIKKFEKKYPKFEKQIYS